MRNPGGYAYLVSPDQQRARLGGVVVEVSAGTAEMDTFTCFHCNSVVHVPPHAPVNFISMCRQCMKPVCEPCSAKGCTPFEKKLEMSEARDRALRSYGF